jgi:hypothetical protein
LIKSQKLKHFLELHIRKPSKDDWLTELNKQMAVNALINMEEKEQQIIIKKANKSKQEIKQSKTFRQIRKQLAKKINNTFAWINFQSLGKLCCLATQKKLIQARYLLEKKKKSDNRVSLLYYHVDVILKVLITEC